MSTTPRNDGGSAFPVPYYADGDGRRGMSLRDYFAAQALAGILAAESDEYGTYPTYVDADGKETLRHRSPARNPDGTENYALPGVPNKVLRTVAQEQALQAYSVADAMLAERGKGGEA